MKLTENQFKKKCEEYGFWPEGFMGYYNLGIAGHHIAVSVFNAGKSRGSQLAYLLQERDKHLKLEKKQ